MKLFLFILYLTTILISSFTVAEDVDESEAIKKNIVKDTEGKIYSGTWATSQYSKVESTPLALNRNTLRQVVKISVGGDAFRFHFSNFFGKTKLAIIEARVALSAKPGTGRIDPETDTLITFNDGTYRVIIPPGGAAVSDTIKFSAPPLSELIVSMYYGTNIPENITGHSGSRTVSYMEEGNKVSSEKLVSSYTMEHWYTLSAIDVLTSNLDTKAVACFGDSITDGRGTTTNKQNRWTDILAQRLQANEATKNIGVLNQGIGGTSVAGGYQSMESPNGLERFQRDILDQTNVKYLVILYGVNDILFMERDEVVIIDTYKQLIQKAHRHGITVYGGTILPFGRNGSYTAERENIRQKVNEWIMTTPAKDGGFDGYIDFSKAVEDPSNSLNLNPEWNFERDGLHPNYLGYEAMGNAIDLDLFTRTSEFLSEEGLDETEEKTTSSTEKETPTISTTTITIATSTTTQSLSPTSTIDDFTTNNEKDDGWIILPNYIKSILLIIILTIFII